MAPYRRPLPTFTLALSSLPKQDPFDDRRDFQREIFSGYYASLVVPRDFLVCCSRARTRCPVSLNCDSTFLPVRCLFNFALAPQSNVFIPEDELEIETLSDDQYERFPFHSDFGCVTEWCQRIVQVCY